jgi:nucleotide-binding universal stress UspA family protein
MTTTTKIILVITPETGSHEAIARVKTLARTLDLEVTVLAVIGGIPDAPRSPVVDLEALIRKDGQVRVEEVVADLVRDGIRAVARVRTGVPFVEIIKEAHEAQADFVLKVSESMATRRSNICAADLNLLRQCPCPVWITRRRERAPYERVVAAVDPSGEAQGRDRELDVRILDQAARLARADGAKLTILHAWELWGESAMSYGRLRVPAAEVRQMANVVAETRGREVAELVNASDLAGVHYEVRIVKGAPAEVIPRVVEASRADLLVMGAVVRTGIRGFLLGSTAENVMQQVGCAILALKPREFVSPVAV